MLHVSVACQHHTQAQLTCDILIASADLHRASVDVPELPTPEPSAVAPYPSSAEVELKEVVQERNDEAGERLARLRRSGRHVSAPLARVDSVEPHASIVPTSEIIDQAVRG